MNITTSTSATLLLIILLNFQACGQASSKKQDNPLVDITTVYTGEVHEQDLATSAYTSSWFNPEYEHFHLSQNAEAAGLIKKNIKNFDILVFMGAWCPDSKREIPHLFKLLDEVGYDMDRLTVITLNRAKKSAEQYEKDWQVIRIPTIIFLQNGKEVNRFVEHPRQTLTDDIAQIVSGKPYKNLYAR